MTSYFDLLPAEILACVLAYQSSSIRAGLGKRVESYRAVTGKIRQYGTDGTILLGMIGCLVLTSLPLSESTKQRGLEIGLSLLSTGYFATVGVGIYLYMEMRRAEKKLTGLPAGFQEKSLLSGQEKFSGVQGS